MIITIHRSTRAIFHGRRLQTHWDEWSFEPCAFDARTDPHGWMRLQTSSIPIRVHVPIGSRLVEQNGQQRLRTHFDDHGLEAVSVAWLAGVRERGFRFGAAVPPVFAPLPPEYQQEVEAPEGERAQGGRRVGSRQP